MIAEPLPAIAKDRTVLCPIAVRSTGGFGAVASDFLTRPLGAMFVMLAAVLVIYLPALNGQFLWDDRTLVLNTYLIRSPLFCLEVFRHTLFNDDSNFYRPTQTLTFIADYWAGGLNPFAYHLTSVLIHAANAWLLCLTLGKVLPVVWRDALDRRQTGLMALGVALVWAVHPVHSAAVAYVSGTADTLAMMFCLLAALLAERSLDAVRSPARAGFAVSAFLCLLLGLCAKEIASIWLLLFLGYMFGFRKNVSRRARWTVVALAAAALGVYVGLRHLTPTPPVPPPLPPMPSKWLLMLRALGDYGSLLLFPAKLFMERQVFAAPGLVNAQDEFFYNTLAFTGVLVLVGLAAGCWWRGQGRRLRCVGASWFLVGYLPISNLFSLNASVAEHWMYLPSIGFLLFLAGVALDLPVLRGHHAAVGLAALTIFIVTAFGLRTWYRAFDWMDELTFFRQTIADGGDVPRARAGLAVAYGRQGADGGDPAADDRAIAVLRDIVRRSPKTLASRINLGLALARRGNSDEARTLLEGVATDIMGRGTREPREAVAVLKALSELDRDDPTWPERRTNLLNRGSQLFPHAWELVKFGAQECERQGRLDEGLALSKRYVEAHWWHAPARCLVGSFQAKLGRTDEAVATWLEASRLDVHDAEALGNAAALCLQKGNLKVACELQERAVARQPDSPRQHVAFAQILERQGDANGARAQVELADNLVRELRPKL